MSCPDCFRGAVLDGEPTGVIADQGAYFAAAPEGSTGTNKRAIVLLTDIFGLPLKNSKILADSFAERLKCDVWVPDFFNGHPPATVEQLDKVLPQKAGQKLSVWDWVVLVFTILPSLPGLIRNRPSVVDARTISLVKAIKETKKYEQIGTIGYCFGGGIALRVGASTDLFQSIVLAHPSPPKDAQLRAIKAPTAWACAEDDMGLTPARMAEIEALYAGRKDSADFVEYEIETYKGTAHGFAARPNLAFPDVKEGFEGAFKQAVKWFEKTLPAA
ncbi:Alpha/Beta hydrolase protein [Mycena filopes]|nr:Alpha/Beta hydrolase protein [Mycena filopes]